MAFQLAYNNTLTLDRNYFRIPAIFNSHQLVIESEDYLRLNQELVIPDVGDVYLPSTTLVNNGKSLLHLDYEYPYRLLVRSRDNRTESQCEISIWYNTSQPTSSGGSSTPSTTTNSTAKTVNASASAIELLEANPNRRGAIINNNSTAILLVNLASSVSPTNYTALLFSGSYYEVPYNWVGAVSGVWTEANGSASIREVF